MPLNLANRDQNSGYLFYQRRLRAALTRCSVRMKHDDRKHHAALAMSGVLVLLGCAWMALLAALRPAGSAGQSAIVGDRATGALYARIDGRLHPALNLTSARLATGSAAAPTWSTAAEIAKQPTGPMIGIPGAPDDLTVVPNPLSAWAICDTASGGAVTVTAIAGELPTAGRAAPMQEPQAILGIHDNAHYLIWNGHRTPLDLADRVLLFTLGLDSAGTRGGPIAVPISNALFDAIPATGPLVVPRIPFAGNPSRLLPGETVGRVLVTDGADGRGYYVLLDEGVQKVSAFVAELIRAGGRDVPSPQSVSPDTVAGLPKVQALDVDFYPPEKLSVVDTEANPVTCARWTKQAGDPRATVTLLSGRNLPTPESRDAHLVSLVRDRRDPDSVEAQQILVLPGAANLVVTTGTDPAATTRETLFWLSPQGVRYGIDTEDDTLRALGIDPDQAVQAPWPLLRTFAAGPAITRVDALLARDAIGAGIG